MTIMVIVDDDDPAIEYHGPWPTLQPSSLNLGGINQSIGNTLHSLNTSSTFSYVFSGINSLLPFRRKFISDLGIIQAHQSLSLR